MSAPEDSARAINRVSAQRKITRAKVLELWARNWTTKNQSALAREAQISPERLRQLFNRLEHDLNYYKGVEGVRRFLGLYIKPPRPTSPPMKDEDAARATAKAKGQWPQNSFGVEVKGDTP